MILTNKILLLFIATVIICILGFIYFTIDGDMVVPNPRIEKDIIRNISIHDFDEIEIRGNRCFVDIVRADTFGIIIKGPDNLVNNYLSITKEEKRLLFEVSSEIRESFYNFNLKISLPSLKKLFADNSNHPIKFRNKNGTIVPSTSFFGQIGINIKNLKEDDFSIKIGGQTTVKIDSCKINNFYVDASNISLISVIKSNINNVKYNLAGISSLHVLDFEGNYNGTLSDLTSISFRNKKQNREVFHSEKFISIIASFGEVIPGLQWGSLEEKVHEFFTDKGATLDTAHIYPRSIYGLKNIDYNNWNYLGLMIESVSALFYNNILYHLQLSVHESVSTNEIVSLLTKNYGTYESAKRGKMWKTVNGEGKEITNVILVSRNNHINTVSFESYDWSELQKKMYTDEWKSLVENVSNE